MESKKRVTPTTCFFSGFYREDGRIRCHVVEVKTKDFKTFSKPLLNFYGKEDGWRGMCSPNITRDGSDYILTFNSWGDLRRKKNQLFYRRSTDLENWGPITPLAGKLTKGVRAIDAALHKTDSGRYFLMWKEKQDPRIATARSIAGPWSRIGGDGDVEFTTRSGDTSDSFENYQFMEIDGKTHLLATHMGNGHLPFLFELQGSPESTQNWISWKNGYAIELPRQGFNTDDRANAAVMWDQRDLDGNFYILYAGNEPRTSRDYAGRGWNRMGIARSSDLITWQAAEARQEGSTDDTIRYCASNNYRKSQCFTRAGLKVSDVKLVEQISSSKCKEGDSYWVQNSSLWVSKGCRGNFSILN